MHGTGLSAIDKTVEHTLQWVDEVCREMHDDDRAHGWAALRAVLQHLRDIVDTDEARQMAAQLPMLLRGLFLEGWTPHRPFPVERDLELFLTNVRLGIGSDAVDPEVAARAVFTVLKWHLGNEALQARARLAPDIRELWPVAA